jgi:biofilm PGA synthesis N-glycosyltransferase PgaC
MIKCCIGIMAYNEEANIANLLNELIQQNTDQVTIDQIVVVASGCTDRTEEFVHDVAKRHKKIKLIRQRERKGKASAVNALLEEIDYEIVVLQSADTLPTPTTIENLVAKFEDPDIGMVGGRPIPVNSPDTFMGYAAHLLWELHHQISLRRPKMGELIAFRNIFKQIPYDTAVDEASIEPLIVGQGLKLIYAPDAVVRNKGPLTINEFLRQRKRIFAGHLYVQDMLGYRVSTMNGFRAGYQFLRLFNLEWRHIFWGPLVVGLELLARMLAIYDYSIWKRKPYAWTMAESTKDLIEAP